MTRIWMMTTTTMMIKCFVDFCNMTPTGSPAFVGFLYSSESYVRRLGTVFDAVLKLFSRSTAGTLPGSAVHHCPFTAIGFL